MQRLFLYLVTLLFAWTATQARIPFDENTKYRIQSKIYGNGSLVLGANHGSPAYLFYATNTQQAPDSWWHIRHNDKGYTISNATNGMYITHSTNRVENVTKGLILTQKPEGEASLWNFKRVNGMLTIQNVEEPTQWFNLRLDGTYLMGTYSGTGTDNELFTIFDEEGNEVSESNTELDQNLLQAFHTLQINNKQLIWDHASNTLLVPLRSIFRKGGDLEAVVNFKLKEPYTNYTLSINDEELETDSQTITIDDVNCHKHYPIVLYNTDGEALATCNLQFTFLPLVEINMPSCNGSTYTRGSIRITQPDSPTHDSLYIADFKYRGVTAQKQNKKSFNIKLRDNQGNSIDRSYLGMRNDNNWILDAMAIDPACMRNRVATDLWNDFANAPYHKTYEPKAMNGTRGCFVEVLLNGEYHGIYCLTEKIDRKQLKLKKFKPASASPSRLNEIHGILYKSAEWCYEVLMGHDMGQKYFPGYAPSPYYNSLGHETWANYEIKYPDYQEEGVDWQPLWKAVNFVATSSQQEFETGVKQHFDFPVVTDYYLFTELLLATDNHGKNIFFYLYDRQNPEGQRLSIAPWDLDGTWGARWDGSTYLTYANQDFDEFLWQNEHGQNTLYHKLNQSKTLRWHQNLASSYSLLRSNHFDEERLIARFTDYAKLFADSEADIREAERWPGYHGDIQAAVDYITAWIKERIQCLDKKYGFDPIISNINQAQHSEYFSARGGSGCMAITAGKAQEVNLYNVQGQAVRSLYLQPGLTEVKHLQPGIYLVNGLKVAVY